MTESPYIKRLNDRTDLKELKANILFGNLLGWVLLLVSALRLWVLEDGEGWLVTFYLGAALLLLSVVYPDPLIHPRRLLNKIAGAVGALLLKGMLAGVHLLAVTPLGFLLQRLKGQKPYYEWDSTPPQNSEGWIDKISTDEGKEANRARTRSASVFKLFEVTGYFVRHGELILVPCLIMFLVIGLLVIFAQSSALAPMIYTLF